MTKGAPLFSSGLESVVAAETRLSDVDGEAGRLILAGHDVEALAASGGYEEACALFGGGTAEAWQRDLGAGRVAAFARLDRLGDALDATDAMDALRAAVAP